MTSRFSPVWVAVLVVVLTGCSTSATQTGGDIAQFYRAEIDRILASNPTDLERSVLADSRVSDAEYRQAQDAFTQCVKRVGGDGFAVTFSSDGSTEVDAPASFYARFDTNDKALAAIDPIYSECSTGTLDPIASLYFDMRNNPSGITALGALRQCFEEHGVPDGAGLSDEAFAQLILGDQTKSDGKGTTVIESPSSYHPSSPAGEACMESFTGGGVHVVSSPAAS